MYKLPEFPPESPISLSRRPASPGYDFEQDDRSSRPCSPASSVGSHASGISHPPGARKRRRITLENVSSSELLNNVADWDDGQQSRQSLPKLPKTTGPEDPLFSNPMWISSGESSMSTAGHSCMYPPLSPLFPCEALSEMRYGDDHMFPSSPPDILSQNGPIVPATIDLESGSTTQPKKRKAKIDMSQRFGGRKRNESIIEQRLSWLREEMHLTAQLHLITEQRDIYHSQRDFFREELSRHVGTQGIPLRPASPCNHTSTRGQSDNHPLVTAPDIPSQSDPTTPETNDLKSGPRNQIDERRKANSDGSRRFRSRKKNETVLVQTMSQLMEQLQLTTKQRDFYRLERDFFTEEVGRYVRGMRQSPSRPASP